MQGLFAAALFLTQIVMTSAPADRYFGKLEMSALRIRYETTQIKKRYESHKLLSEQAEHLLLLTEDALHQWARLYPNDTWLPSSAYNMAVVYAELAGTTARDHAVGLFVYVKSHFPTTSYARQSRDELHRGVSTKPQPRWTLVPTASPPTPSLAPSVSPSSAPSSAPTVTASPS